VIRKIGGRNIDNAIKGKNRRKCEGKKKREGKNIKKSKICTMRENKSKGRVSKGALCI
jgi:hypothetical protein